MTEETEVKRQRKPVKKDTDLIEVLLTKNTFAGLKGETVMMERKSARVLQENNAIKVVL